MESRDSPKNTIWLRQNKSNALSIQAASRWLYNSADWLNVLDWIVILFLALFGTFKIQAWIVIFQMFWFFISICLDWIITRKVEAAANYKLAFDQYVYGWSNEIPESVVRSAQLLLGKYETWGSRQVSHDGSDPNIGGVKDWYFCKPEWNEDHAIQNAMQENTGFDQGINWLMLVEIALACTGIITMCVLNDESLLNMLTSVFVIYSVPARKLMQTGINVTRVQFINKHVELELSKAKNTTDLIEAQKLINEKRVIPNTSSMVVYWFVRRKLNHIFHNKRLL